MVSKQVKEKRFLLIFLVIPCLLISQSMNSDVWFLLNHGRYVLEHGIPVIEPFTIHAGFSFVMQQWLTSVIFWLLYSNFGIVGLFALLLAVFASIITVTFKLCMRLSSENFIVSYAITFFVSVFVSIFIVQRPYIFTALLVTLEIYILERYIATEKKRYLLLLPLISFLQINLHSAMWLLLFVVMIPYIIDAFSFKLLFFKGQGYPKRWLFVCIILMLLAGLINPYGLDAMTYLFRSYGYAAISSTVEEMKPVDINSVLGKIIFGLIFCVILIYQFFKKGTTRLRFVLLTMGTGYLAISSYRNLLFFSICGLFPLSYYLKGVKLKETDTVPSKRTRLFRVILTVFICAVVVFGITSKYQAEQETGHKPQEAAAVDYLLQHADTGKTVLYTDYNTGAYAEFMGFKAYLDARAEVFVLANNKKEDVYLEFLKLQNGALYYKDFLDKYHFTHLLVSKTDMLYTYLPHDDAYKLAYEDENYCVYEADSNQY